MGVDSPEAETTPIRPSFLSCSPHPLPQSSPFPNQPPTPKEQGRHRGVGTGGKQGDFLPFHVNVAHLLPGDAEVIQDHILGVPNNTTQEKPAEEDDSNPRGFPTKGWAVLVREAKKSAHPRLCCLPGWTFGQARTRVRPEWPKAWPESHLLLPPAATSPPPCSALSLGWGKSPSGSPWGDVERRSRPPQGLWKQVDPHLQLPLGRET